MANKVLEGELVKKPGPDSKYLPIMCQQIMEVAQEGGHIAAMRAKLGYISKDTFYRWQEEYPEFKEAVEASKLISQVYYEKIGLLGATGQIKDFNATTYALIMNNKFKDEYSRGTGGGSHTEITYNNTLQLSSDEVKQQIAQKIEKLRNLGQDPLNSDE